MEKDKSLDELKEEFVSLTQELHKCHNKFFLLSQEEEICKKQELLLKSKVHDLSGRMIAEEKKLDSTRQQIEIVVEVDCSPEDCNASLVSRPGASVSSGLNDKLKSVEKGSESFVLPAFNPLQLGRTHVSVVEERSSLK
ncbi:hypothetical protein BDFB_013514 [Asbolus verrucosus]|uniref:Uncharacterized protein n=1 Tax=Asbolus verrucosus TaxID=1661398 RepID=A0A482VWB6_ASBVE|nr:hypothetical protein BDFB_013514 [Asbolus verrucosus]